MQVISREAPVDEAEASAPDHRAVTPHAEPSSPPSAAEASLTRAVVLGGAIGFVVVFALAVGALLLITPYGLGPAVGSAAFIAAFCGVGFGAMVAGSLHT